jgi:hypothetical protein
MGGYCSSVIFGPDTYVCIPDMESLRNLGIKLEGGALPCPFDLSCLRYRRFMFFTKSYTEASLFSAFGILYIDIAHLPPQQVNQTWGANIGTIYYSSTLANTVISTILIISRILFMAGKSGISRYRRILEAVVESAALYSIMLIIYVPFVSNTAPWAGPPTLMLQSVVIPITVCLLNRPPQVLQLTLRWIPGHRTHADHPTNLT